MPLNALHHVTVKTSDLEATRDFYRDILGLEVGFRPELDFPGYWLYCGEVPVVHLVSDPVTYWWQAASVLDAWGWPA